jgi:tRNA 2-selenouridine synthase SelU
MNAREKFDNAAAKFIMRLPDMTDDELTCQLSHMNQGIRDAAKSEAAARWAETIMPKDA